MRDDVEFIIGGISGLISVFGIFFLGFLILRNYFKQEIVVSETEEKELPFSDASKATVLVIITIVCGYGSWYFLHAAANYH